MPSLKDFVAALQAGWFPALAALIGCAIVLAGDHYSLPYLSTTPVWVLTTAAFVGVFSFSILVANIAYAPVYFWRKSKERRARAKFQETVRREFFSLPKEEMAILAYLLSSGRKAFVAQFGDRRLSPLIAKGLIRQLSGTHSMLEWPHIVQDDVWQLLVDNEEQLRIENIDQISDPFT